MRETPLAGKPPEVKGERASAGSAAREAERLLAVTLDLLLIADFDYRVRRGNLAWTQVIGYRAEEVLGRSFLEFVHPEDVRRTKEEVDLIAATGSGSVDFENRVVTKDGAVKWLLWSAKASLEERLLYASAKDVTERKQAEDELARSRAQLADAERIAAFGSWAWDARSDKLTWSPQQYEIFGVDPETFKPSYESYLQLVHPDDREHVDRVARSTLENRGQFTLDHRAVRPDGEVRTLFCRATVVTDTEPSATRVVGVSQDVTERRVAEEALRAAEERFRLAFQHAPIGMAILEVDGRWSQVNQALADFLGYPPDQLKKMTFRDVTHPDDLERDVAALADLRAGRLDQYQVEKRYVRADGTVVWGLLTASLIRDTDGEPRHAISQVLDVTSRVRAERFRAAQQAVAHVTVESSGVDESARMMLGAVGEAMEWHGGAVWTPADDGEALRRLAVWSAADSRSNGQGSGSGGEPGGELEAVRDGELPTRVWSSGAPRVVSLGEAGPDPHPEAGPGGAGERFCIPILNDGISIGAVEFHGKVIGTPDEDLEHLLESLGSQIGQLFIRKRAEEQLAHQALHDALTGLPNRALFLDRLQQALARARRRSSAVAVLFLDVDNFKLINDTRGHETGDEFLKLFAERVGRVLRPADSIARFGGDEFVIMVEDLSSDRDARRVAERVLQALERPFELGDDEHVASASIGIALSPDGDDDASTLLRDADAAMYLVKEHGRAGYELYTESMRTEALARMETERALRHGLKRDELWLCYQPVIELDSGRIAGIEALLRWNHPERGLVQPDEFIPVAEATGAIVTMGAWVLREACRQAARWREELGEAAPLPLSLNLSARQLVQPDLTATLARAVTDSGIDFGDVGVEVTEGALIDNAVTSMRNLRALRAAGVKVVLDDFGTGYSSLSHLNTLPLDGLKIDRSFVTDIEEDPRSEAIVEAVAAMGRAMGLSVVAEGVETAEQATRTAALGCAFGQGHHFSPPVTAEEVPALLEGLLPGRH